MNACCIGQEYVKGVMTSCNLFGKMKKKIIKKSYYFLCVRYLNNIHMSRTLRDKVPICLYLVLGRII